MYKKGDVDTGYKDKGYVYVSPTFGNISGTAVRDGMSKGDESKRKAFFKKVYGKFDPKIFNLISGRLSKLESVMESFFKLININKTFEVDLIEIINMDNNELISKFSWFYVPKRDANYLKRNAIIALANNPLPNSHELFDQLLYSDSEIIRLYSVWALWRVDRLNTINKETFYKREVSQNVIHEFDLLFK